MTCMGDWVTGTGVDMEEAGAVVGAGGESEGEEHMAGAEGDVSGSQGDGGAGEATVVESWWVVVDSSTVEGAGRVVELDVARQACVATVEVDGTWGDGQKSWGIRSGGPGWPEGLEAWAGQADSMINIVAWHCGVGG